MNRSLRVGIIDLISKKPDEKLFARIMKASFVFTGVFTESAQTAHALSNVLRAPWKKLKMNNSLIE